MNALSVMRDRPKTRMIADLVVWSKTASELPGFEMVFVELMNFKESNFSIRPYKEVDKKYQVVYQYLKVKSWDSTRSSDTDLLAPYLNCILQRWF